MSPEILPPRWPEALPPTGLRPADTLEQLAHVRSHLLKHRHDCCRFPHPGWSRSPCRRTFLEDRKRKRQRKRKLRHGFLSSPRGGEREGFCGGCHVTSSQPAQLARAHTLHPSWTKSVKKSLVRRRLLRARRRGSVFPRLCSLLSRTWVRALREGDGSLTACAHIAFRAAVNSRN